MNIADLLGFWLVASFEKIISNPDCPHSLGVCQPPPPATPSAQIELSVTVQCPGFIFNEYCIFLLVASFDLYFSKIISNPG